MADQVVDIPTTTKTSGANYANVFEGNLGTNTSPYYSPILDTYTGASVAYGLTKLRTGYSGSAIRVRRSSDSTQSDIGFSGNDLNLTALTAFVGVGSGFIVKWYDQSGNGNDLTQNTTSNQPRIVNAGSVHTVNGKPAIYFDGTNDNLLLTSSVSATVPWSSFQVSKRVVTNKMDFVLASISAAPPQTVMHYTDSKPFISGGATIDNGNADTTIDQTIWSGVKLNTTGYIWKNNSPVTITNSVAYSTSGDFDRAGARLGGVYANCYAQCFIFFGSDKRNDASGITSTLNTYFSVY